MAWMRWAAKAVDRTAKFETRARAGSVERSRGREHELCLAALDARGVGRRARQDDAGDDCKRTGTVWR
uniref:Uncharacterized protein n=1 Tax=Oryza sativa subsp. japonica TaxID=39947 RepID=Q6ZIH0_ORYSJ|nr:hypothetical protein [Oryza sativa Japonica Group]BAD15440.1 hypothetical protein [Oryza sativa Japonica Group]